MVMGSSLVVVHVVSELEGIEVPVQLEVLLATSVTRSVVKDSLDVDLKVNLDF